MKRKILLLSVLFSSYVFTAVAANAGESSSRPAWPFGAWDRAEAFIFNPMPYGPGIPLRVYDAKNGWSPHIVTRKPIERRQGERAVEWTIATRGEIEVSKCPFPRHAVVLYAGEAPVGSVNVCFECGDILVWPEFEPPVDDEKAYKQKLAAYHDVFPRWQAFFRDELGFAIEWAIPPAAPVPIESPRGEAAPSGTRMQR